MTKAHTCAPSERGWRTGPLFEGAVGKTDWGCRPCSPSHGNLVVDATAAWPGGADAEAKNAVFNVRGDCADAAARRVEGPNGRWRCPRPPFGGKAQLHVGGTRADERRLAPLEQDPPGFVGELRALALHVGKMHEQDPPRTLQRLAVEGGGLERGGGGVPTTK